MKAYCRPLSGITKDFSLQKQTAQRNMAQLSRLCSDWRQQGTVPEGDE